MGRNDDDPPEDEGWSPKKEGRYDHLLDRLAQLVEKYLDEYEKNHTTPARPAFVTGLTIGAPGESVADQAAEQELWRMQARIRQREAMLREEVAVISMMSAQMFGEFRYGEPQALVDHANDVVARAVQLRELVKQGVAAHFDKLMPAQLSDREIALVAQQFRDDFDRAFVDHETIDREAVCNWIRDAVEHGARFARDAGAPVVAIPLRGPIGG